jgi:hypothetical protein
MQMSNDEHALIQAGGRINTGGMQMDSSQVKFLLETSKVMRKFSAAILRCDIGPKGEVIPVKYNMQHTYLDEQGNAKTQIVEVQLPPLMNELGIKDMTSYLESYLNINMYLSEHTIEEIADMVKETMITVLDTLQGNYQEYDIRPKDLPQILNIMLNYIYEAASRSRDGITNTLLTKTTQSIQHEVSKIEGQDEKKGFFNWRR